MTPGSPSMRAHHLYGDGARRSRRRKAEGPQEAVIDGQVDERDGAYPQEQHAHHVLPRPPHLRRQVGDLVPSAVSEEDEDHGHPDAARARRGRMGAMRRRAARRASEAERDHRHETEDDEPRQDVLRPLPCLMPVMLTAVRMTTAATA